MLISTDAGSSLSVTGRILVVIFVLDVCSLTASFVLLFLGSVSQYTIYNNGLMVSISIVLGIYGSLSLVCNILACYGMYKGRHYLLIPYLVFIPVVISFLGVIITRMLWSNGVNHFIALPFIVCLILAYVWLKLLKQWATVRHRSQETSRASRTLPNRWPEDEDDIQHVVENLNIITCYLTSTTTTEVLVSEQEADLPPQYESIKVISEDPDVPPSYDDVIKGENFSDVNSELKACP